MKSLSLLALCTIVPSLLQPCLAHGGQYRGPGDVVPPNPGGSRGTGGPGPTPAPPGTGEPSPPGFRPPGHTTGPITGPKGPGGGTRPGATGPCIELVDDLTTWDFWWEFNKDPFLRLKNAVHAGGPVTSTEDIWLGNNRKGTGSNDTLRPTHAEMLDEILPALKKAIDGTTQHDLVTSCMIAMAKIGEDHPDFHLVDVFAPRLASDSPEVRETAAIAIGIAGIAGEREFTMLRDLAANNANGAKVCDRASVDDRTRAFATYGLGLMAYRTSNLSLKSKVLEVVRALLDNGRESNRDLRVAAIHAISLLNIDRSLPGGAALQDDAVACLDRFFSLPLGPGEQLIQSHCPTAIAKLIGRQHPSADAWKRRFAAELSEKNGKKRPANDISRSCAIALGLLCRPDDAGPADASPDRSISELLLEVSVSHRDVQTRYFAMMALAEIGGTNNRSALLNRFDSAKPLDKSWVAIALGVYAFRDLAARETGGIIAEPDALIGTTLLEALRREKAPSLQAAIAIGLGLSRYLPASDHMRDLMLKSVAKEDLAGYLCIGLALMKEGRAKPDIENMVHMATRRPELLKQAAIALGILGDKSAAEQLQIMLSDDSANLAQMSALSQALGFIGDRRSIEPLRRMLFDPSLRDLSRAFAAVALGNLADKEMLPWNSKIAVDTNYRAAVETMTDRSTGVLDIL